MTHPTSYDSIAQAAKHLGVTRGHLQQLKRDGAAGFRGSRVYPGELQACLEERSAAVNVVGEAMNKEQLECRRLLAQCKRIEHAFEVDAGTVLPRADVLTAIGTIGGQLKSLLRSIYEDEEPPYLSGLSPEAVRVRNRASNDRICTAFYEATGKIAKAA